MKVSRCTGLASMRKMCRGAEMVSQLGDTLPCKSARQHSLKVNSSVAT